jgi:LPXTG-motif cell wall-anchored protein
MMPYSMVGDTPRKGESMRRLLVLTSVSFWVAGLVLVPVALAFGQTATPTPTPTATALPGTGGAGGVALVAAALLLGAGILSFAIFRNRS